VPESTANNLRILGVSGSVYRRELVDSIERSIGEMITRSELDASDRSSDPALDELVEFTAILAGVPYAYIGWLDFNRLFFKSRFGFEATDQPLSSTACRFVIEEGSPLLVQDAASDPRFPAGGIDIPGALPCRSYAGIPLMTGNHHIVGTIAILDPKPDQFSEEHLLLLDVVRRQISTRLELYNRIRSQ